MFTKLSNSDIFDCFMSDNRYSAMLQKVDPGNQDLGLDYI